MKYYKLTMNTEGENDIVCHFYKEFIIPQNALIVGKLYDGWDENLEIYYSSKEGNVWTDYLANDKGWFLVSERFKSLLESVNSDIQFLRVTVREEKDASSKKYYYFANVLRVVDAICLEKSKYFETEIPGMGTIYTVSKFGIYANKTKNSDVFKLANRHQIPLFASEIFKDLIDRNNITGIVLTEIAVE